jgi:lysophospholipase L1-like esterase
MGYRRLGISIRIIAVLSIFKGIICRALRIATAAAALAVAACGGKSRGPGPTPVAQPPQITCPADVTVKSVEGPAQAVTFPDPTVTNGAAPVTTTCDRTSGTTFPLGTTAVSCTATDAQQRRASCAFNVTLSGFALSVQKFETVGDSLTEGENGLLTFVDTPNAYPTKLQALFDRDYPGQGITVINRGMNGQRAEVTRDLLPNHLLRDRPEAVLIMTGYNNLTTPCATGQANTADCGDATEFVAFAVRDCIRKAKESPVGVKFIFASTLTPPGPSGSRRIDPNAILEVNRKIRQQVALERVVLLDPHPAFVGHETEYVNVDGLHLRPAGYQALADAFFAVVKATIPQTPLQPLTR